MYLYLFSESYKQVFNSFTMGAGIIRNKPVAFSAQKQNQNHY